VGDHVFLKVKANRSSMKLGNCSKLVARYCGSFEILERIGPVDYMIALPASMSVHNVFHVSLFKKYIPNVNHVIHWNVIQVEQEGTFQVHPAHILDRKIKHLRNQAIRLVKVLSTVLMTLLGSMRMQCGQNTCISLRMFEILLYMCT
jgi:hypothetical protein